ncbi:MAG: hypothetical protein HQL51_11205 [Magnetococcales bacterium]|nr:hypothetical protein [Magnetococcales bacterium]
MGGVFGFIYGKLVSWIKKRPSRSEVCHPAIICDKNGFPHKSTIMNISQNGAFHECEPDFFKPGEFGITRYISGKNQHGDDQYFHRNHTVKYVRANGCAVAFISNDISDYEFDTKIKGPFPLCHVRRSGTGDYESGWECVTDVIPYGMLVRRGVLERSLILLGNRIEKKEEVVVCRKKKELPEVGYYTKVKGKAAHLRDQTHAINYMNKGEIEKLRAMLQIDKKECDEEKDRLNGEIFALQNEVDQLRAAVDRLSPERLSWEKLPKTVLIPVVANDKPSQDGGANKPEFGDTKKR